MLPMMPSAIDSAPFKREIDKIRCNKGGHTSSLVVVKRRMFVRNSPYTSSIAR